MITFIAAQVPAIKSALIAFRFHVNTLNPS